MTPVDREFLLMALAEAEARQGFTAPNPPVGAVVVKDGLLISSGTHQEAGAPHAERIALLKAGKDGAKGATVFVTLEPCNHFGKTPPCSIALVEAGTRRVVYSMRDPNPRVKGGGHEALQTAGIEVIQITIPEISAFYRGYLKLNRFGLPRVTLKIATSLDGKISGPDGKRVKISGPEFDRYVSLRRLKSDAILTTAKTVISDNPRLNARLEQEVSKRVYVIDRKALILEKPELLLYRTAKEIVVLHGQGVTPSERSSFSNVKFIPVEENGGVLDLKAALFAIGNRGEQQLWVEAGASFSGALIRQGLVDELVVCIGAKRLGEDGILAPTLVDLPGFQAQWKKMGADAICLAERIEV